MTLFGDKEQHPRKAERLTTVDVKQSTLKLIQSIAAVTGLKRLEIVDMAVKAWLKNNVNITIKNTED